MLAMVSVRARTGDRPLADRVSHLPPKPTSFDAGDCAGAGDEAPGALASLKPRRSHRLRPLLAVPTPLLFLLSLGLAALVLWRRGILSDVDQAARGADAGIVVGAFLIYLTGLALQSLRWHVLALLIKGHSDAARAAEAFLTSLVVNYAIPIGLAVPARAALTKRALGLSTRETGSLALWEVACDVGVLGLGSLVWLLSSSGGRTEAARLIPSTSVLLVLGVIGVAAAAIVLGATARWPRLRHVQRRFGTALSDLLTYPQHRPRIAAWALALTFAYWLVQGSVLWLLLDAVAVEPGLRLILGLVTLPVLIGMLSPVPGGAGIREALMVVVAHVQDVDATAVLLAALTYRLSLFAGVPLLYTGVRVWLIARRSMSHRRSPA